MSKELLGSLELNRAYQMDCLEGMKLIPDGSIDLILCDLPYGTMKNAGLDGWKNQTTQWDERLDTEALFVQYERILRENGMMVLFSQEPYTSELRTYKAYNIEFAYPMIWKKDHFANALISKKPPVSYFEDINVFYKKYDVQNKNPLRLYARVVMEYIRLTLKEINKKLGHRKAEHFFYVESTQFKLCTEETYNELTAVFRLSDFKEFKPFAELKEMNKKYQRVFNLEGENKKSNVLEFKKEYQGLHPTQKPVALFEYLIRTYTNEGDIVLDNCLGSGTTAVACELNNRKWVGFETEPKYIEIINKRLDQIQLDNDLKDYD